MSPPAPAHVQPTRLAGHLAIPSGSRRARSQRLALAVGLDLIEAQPWYANRARHYAEIWRRLVLAMDWSDSTSRPGHLGIACGVTGNRGADVSPDTVGRAVAWFQAVGLLGLVQGGTTYGRAGNAAAVYVICIPSKHTRRRSRLTRFADPPRPRRGLVSVPRTREAPPSWPKGKPKSRGDRPAAGLTPETSTGPAPTSERASKRIKATELAREVSGRLAMARALSLEHVRSLVRPFAVADWSAGDILEALNNRPGGEPWTYVGAVADVAAWMRWRLSRWLAPGGLPRLAPSQVRAREHLALLAEQNARRERAATTTAAAPNAEYLAARARLRGNRGGNRLAGLVPREVTGLSYRGQADRFDPDYVGQGQD